MRIVILICFIVFLLGCSPAVTQPKKEYPKNKFSSNILQPNTNCPLFSKTLSDHAIFLVWHHYDPKGFRFGSYSPKVRHIDVVQDDCVVNLFMTVNYTINDGEAKDMGEHLVAQFNHIAPGSFADSSGGISMGLFDRTEIKEGMYTYTISVYTPDNKPLAIGVKAADSKWIEWR